MRLFAAALSGREVVVEGSADDRSEEVLFEGDEFLCGAGVGNEIVGHL